MQAQPILRSEAQFHNDLPAEACRLTRRLTDNELHQLTPSRQHRAAWPKVSATCPRKTTTIDTAAREKRDKMKGVSARVGLVWLVVSNQRYEKQSPRKRASNFVSTIGAPPTSPIRAVYDSIFWSFGPSMGPTYWAHTSFSCSAVLLKTSSHTERERERELALFYPWLAFYFHHFRFPPYPYHFDINIAFYILNLFLVSRCLQKLI